MLTAKCIGRIESQRERAVVSHISRKTSEMWGTPSFVREPGAPVPSKTGGAGLLRRSQQYAQRDPFRGLGNFC
jgi:hypothetical protein